MYPPSRRYPSRYPMNPPPRYPMDNSIGGDMGSRYYPENRYPETRPDRYPESDGRYYPTTVTGTRYPTSDNRFPVGNDRSPIFILKYGNRVSGNSHFNPAPFEFVWFFLLFSYYHLEHIFIIVIHILINKHTHTQAICCFCLTLVCINSQHF